MDFDFASLTLLLFWMVPRMVPSIAQVVFVTSPKALSEPQLHTSMACMWSFG
jgi:hypothetical protein